jgi:hypothetical protein
MTPRQLEIIQHTLGCDQYGKTAHRDVPAHPDYFPYHRNHFCAGASDEPDCRALVEIGYMQQHETTEWLPYFNCSVTKAGIEAMRRESPAPPKKTRSQLRFEEYRNFSDAYDCSFREFLRISKTDWYKDLKAGKVA